MGRLADVAWPDEEDIWGEGRHGLWFRTQHVLGQHEGLGDPYATIALIAFGC